MVILRSLQVKNKIVSETICYSDHCIVLHMTFFFFLSAFIYFNCGLNDFIHVYLVMHMCCMYCITCYRNEAF